MIKKKWLLGAGVFLLAFASCDDTTDSLGMSMLTDRDVVEVGTATFKASTQTVATGPVFAKSKIGYVGRYTDPNFGTFEGSFLTELHCPEGTQFPFDEMVTGKAYSTELFLYYSEYFGDSLSTNSLNVYQLDKKLTTNHYTDIDPTSFYNPSDLIASQSYTAVDKSLTDDAKSESGYVPYVRIVLDNAIGQRIIDLNKTHPEYFESDEAFAEHVLKGLYIKPILGDGTVLYIEDIYLNVVFQNYVYEDDGSKMQTYDESGDSIVYYRRTFAATSEVLQANSFTNTQDKLTKRIEDTDVTYLKTPAGLVTEATLPIDEINNTLSNDTLNAVRIDFQNYIPEDNKEFTMDVPDNVILMRARDMKSFFENNELPDDSLSYLTTHSSSNKYIFGNIARLVRAELKDKEAAKKAAGGSWTPTEEATWEDKMQWGKVYLVPVQTTYSTSSSSSSSKTLIEVQNDLTLSAAKLVGKSNKIDVEVIYSKFNF